MGAGGYVKEQEGERRWLQRRRRTKDNFPIVERKFENKFAQQNRKAFSDDSEEEAERKKISPLSLFYDLRDGGGRFKKWPEVKVTIPADIFSKRLLCCGCSPANTKLTHKSSVECEQNYLRAKCFSSWKFLCGAFCRWSAIKSSLIFSLPRFYSDKFSMTRVFRAFFWMKLLDD